MRIVVYREDAKEMVRWTEFQVEEGFDEVHLLVLSGEDSTDLGDISTIDQTWEPRG